MTTGRRILLSAGARVLAISLVGGPVAAAAPAAAVGDTLVTPAVEASPDLALIAGARGWTVAEALAQQRAADMVGTIATKVAAARPDVFIGSALSAKPGGAPTLYVKGPADTWTRALVSAAAAPVILADGQPYSFLELEARVEAVHHAVEALGYRNVMTRVDITGGGAIPVEVGAQSGLSAAAGDVLAALPDKLRAGVVVSVVDSSGFRDTTSFGGMWMRDDGAYMCTSGWTVMRATRPAPRA